MTFLRQRHNTAMLVFILSLFNPSSLLTAFNTMMQLFCAKLFYHFIPTRITASRERGYVHLRLVPPWVYSLTTSHDCLPLPVSHIIFRPIWPAQQHCFNTHMTGKG